ncbi:MAG: hypothetical protein ACI4DK_06985 [Lachnospiraceae bacterium]
MRKWSGVMIWLKIKSLYEALGIIYIGDVNGCNIRTICIFGGQKSVEICCKEHEVQYMWTGK